MEPGARCPSVAAVRLTLFAARVAMAVCERVPCQFTRRASLGQHSEHSQEISCLFTNVKINITLGCKRRLRNENITKEGARIPCVVK